MLLKSFAIIVGVSSTLAMLGLPANAEDADVQQLKQEMAALQKKLNVLEKQVEVNHAQEQAAVRSYETLTSGKDGGDPWKPFGVKITFGGYAALEGVFRDKDQATSIGSAFQKIPFDNLQQAHVNELRATAQQSRLTLLAEGSINDHEKYAGFIEFGLSRCCRDCEFSRVQQLHAAAAPVLRHL